MSHRRSLRWLPWQHAILLKPGLNLSSFFTALQDMRIMMMVVVIMFF